jgi:hypothetical protein
MSASGARKLTKVEEEKWLLGAMSGKPILKTMMQPNANKRFVTGPANATQIMSRLGLWRL